MAAFFWPALACLVLVSLWRLAAELCGRQVAAVTCLLCLAIPALQVVALHARPYAALLVAIEFAAWLGMPVTLLAASGAGEDLGGELRRGKVTAAPALALALLAALAILAGASGAEAQVARTWLLLLPVAFLVARGGIQALFSVRRSPVVWAILVVQLGTIYLVKVDRHFR